MDRQKLLNAEINYQEGLNRFCGNAQMYEKFLNRFPQDENYEMLKQALCERDYQTAFRAAHTLKGMAGNLSLTGLYQSVIPLVEALRSGQTDGLEPLLKSVKESYQNTVQAVK